MSFRLSIVFAALAAAAVAVKNGGVQGAVVPKPETALLENDVNGVAMVGGDAKEAAELPKSDESEELLPPQDSPSGSHLMPELNSDSERDEGLSIRHFGIDKCVDSGPVTDDWVWVNKAVCVGGKVLRTHWVSSDRCCEDACNGDPDLPQKNDHTCFLYNRDSDSGENNCFCMTTVDSSAHKSRPGKCYARERNSDSEIVHTRVENFECIAPRPVTTEFWVRQNKAFCSGSTPLRHFQVTSRTCCEDACNGALKSQDEEGAVSVLKQSNDDKCFVYNQDADSDDANCFCMTDCAEMSVKASGSRRRPGRCFVRERNPDSEIVQNFECIDPRPVTTEFWVRQKKALCSGSTPIGHFQVTSRTCCEDACNGALKSQDEEGAVSVLKQSNDDDKCFVYNKDADSDEASCLCMTDCAEMSVEASGSRRRRGRCFVRERNSDSEIVQNFECIDPRPVTTEFWVRQKKTFCSGTPLGHFHVTSRTCCEDACNSLESQDEEGAVSVLKQSNHDKCFVYNHEADSDEANCFCMTDCAEMSVEASGSRRRRGRCFVREMNSDTEIAEERIKTPTTTTTTIGFQPFDHDDLDIEIQDQF